MGFSIALLPILAFQSDPRIVATGDLESVELSMSGVIRDRIHDGWSVLEVETSARQLAITIGKREGYERHVIAFGKPAAYRVEPAGAPVDPDEPGEFMLAALAAPRGGFTVESGCGDYFARGYIIEDESTGQNAQSLVARTLATADDLGQATNLPNGVRFVVSRNSQQHELRVWLDPKGTVIEAQVRLYKVGFNAASYDQMPALKAALRKTRVIAIHHDQLVTTVGKFVIDSELYDLGGDGECGC